LQQSAQSENAFLVIISLLPGRPLVSHPCQNFSFRSLLFVRKICQEVCPIPLIPLLDSIIFWQNHCQLDVTHVCYSFTPD